LFDFSKGKVKALDIIENDKSSTFVEMFSSMGQRNGEDDIQKLSAFVCHLYGQSKLTDVNEARYHKLIQMSGKYTQVNR
jgi:hypothetical protein